MVGHYHPPAGGHSTYSMGPVNLHRQIGLDFRLNQLTPDEEIFLARSLPS